MKQIVVKDLVEKFKLEVLAGENGLDIMIESDDIHRPGLDLTGYLEFFPSERIQLLGKQEITYLHTLDTAEKEMRIKDIVKLRPPCFIITRNQENITYLKKHCENEGIPLLRTKDKTTKFMTKLNNYLEKAFAQEEGIHGVCLDIFGVGVLLRGESGIGKSELALSLVERGHRLISDDLVILKRLDHETLIGSHNDNNRHFLALRGIGMIDVLRLYGTGAYQEETKIDLDILISPWKDNVSYDAIGIEKKKSTYLEVPVDHIEIPVRPGRDLAALIEVAAKNWRLQQEGYNALEEFEKRTIESF